MLEFSLSDMACSKTAMKVEMVPPIDAILIDAIDELKEMPVEEQESEC